MKLLRAAILNTVLIASTSGCTLELAVQDLSSGSMGELESISIDSTVTISGVKYTDNIAPSLTFSVATLTPAQMKISDNANCTGGSWVAYASTLGSHSLTAGDGTKDLSVQFKSSAGDVTSCVNTQVVLDTSVPTGASIAIAADYVDGSSVNFVKNSSPTFTLSASDPTLYQMQFSNTANCSTGSYEDFSSSKSWALSAGEGAKSISVKFRDRFNHDSSCVSVDAVLDSTSSVTPVVELAFGADGVGSMTYTPKVYVKNLAANEAADATHAGFLDYQGRIVRVSDGQAAQAWSTLGSGGTLQATGLTLVDGVNYRWEIQSRDRAGNTSASVSVTWTATVTPAYLLSLQNRTPSTEFESSAFTVSGIHGTLNVTVDNGAKVCATPCADWSAAGTSLSVSSGASFTLKMNSPAAGARTSNLIVGSFATTWKISTGELCPANYVLIPGENGTLQNEFCVAKYEMKIAGDDDGYQTYNPAFIADSRPTGTSWRDINLTQMTTHCQALGAGFDLPTNSQWNVIARNIAGVAGNWSTGAVGSGQLNQGNRSSSDQEPADANDNYACANLPGFSYPADTATCSDSVWHNFKRTHKLSNGSVLWDFSGGSWEGVKYSYPDTFTGTNDLVANYTDSNYFKILAGALGFTCLGPAGGNEFCGFGKAWVNDSRPASALFRGGSASNGQQAGVFAIDLDYDSTHSDGGHGFRCISPLVN
ncbi:hypothetical protein AAAA73_14265 [Bdellovibrio sp. GT3]